MTGAQAALAAERKRLAAALLLEPRAESEIFTDLADAYSVSHDVVRSRIERRNSLE